MGKGEKTELNKDEKIIIKNRGRKEDGDKELEE